MAESHRKVAIFSIQATEMVEKSDERGCGGKFL